ncbi:endo-1,4-beta-xylanase 5-like [Andrographis paniculata]|uniref:endo-1,4-beta-xylanase 5-like n=1 Tax=Andrographis paniculata TaxID=175694 RepID=UPI0021E9728E|nr:endo-1,4-beta-xylanase 5-like [Andrographis paniculata]
MHSCDNCDASISYLIKTRKFWILLYPVGGGLVNNIIAESHFSANSSSNSSRMKNKYYHLFIVFLGLCHYFLSVSAYPSLHEDDDRLMYDYSAYTECKSWPEDPLYNGGIIKEFQILGSWSKNQSRIPVNSPAFVLKNLTGNTIYCFSSWVRIKGAASAVIQASLTSDNTTFTCMGTVTARRGCWSFLKGGFVLDSPLTGDTYIYFKNSDGKNLNVSISGGSLQPFTPQQWKANQQSLINTERKREVTLHVSDEDGNRLPGATVIVEQVSKDFPFGSAIADTILGNEPYQKWFVERFNAAVFENELKWYATEGKPGQVNYTIPDQMLAFVRRNQMVARGHNIFWENPRFNPSWVRNLTATQLKSAVNSRIESLMTNYRNEFIHWDVDNEMLHFDFYEDKLGPNASLEFFLTAQKSDPSARLFMNEYNVLETCDDMRSTVDQYVSRLKELEAGGVTMDGIGLQAHFTVPNPPLIRAMLDKLGTLKLPIWLTELDIQNTFDQETQAKYLEVALREGFSHPSVNGIMLWTALHPQGCYRMCLTDNNFHNLPAGDVVDSLLKEWRTGTLERGTDEHGVVYFSGYLGEHRVTASYANRTTISTFSLSPDDETKHWNIHL